MLLLGTHLAAADPDFYRFSTGKYTVEMRVRFPAPYEGTQLALSAGSYASTTSSALSRWSSSG